jgi:hypothetical protein
VLCPQRHSGAGCTRSCIVIPAATAAVYWSSSSMLPRKLVWLTPTRTSQMSAGR